MEYTYWHPHRGAWQFAASLGAAQEAANALANAIFWPVSIAVDGRTVTAEYPAAQSYAEWCRTSRP
jgi:hypothetical protein